MSETNGYYSNLLILEYRNKPKAKATIESVVGLLPDDMILSIINGFNIETAVGKQLDILGKYIGISRDYIKDGAVTLLTDDEYRVLLKLKIACNTSNLSHGSIDRSLYDLFGSDVRMDSVGNMEMTYFVPFDFEPVVIAAIQKNALPRPMGVEVHYVIEDKKKFFAYCDYDDQSAVYRTGFRDYNNPDKDGETFTYSKRK